MTEADSTTERLRAMEAEPRNRRFAPSTLRAAWWAVRGVVGVRRQLASAGVRARVPAPPPLPWGSRVGVYGVLHRLEPNCIERAVIEQAWLCAYGIERDIVIGVRTDAAAEGAGSFRAHAWLDGRARPHELVLYKVIHRIPATTADPAP